MEWNESNGMIIEWNGIMEWNDRIEWNGMNHGIEWN